MKQAVLRTVMSFAALLAVAAVGSAEVISVNMNAYPFASNDVGTYAAGVVHVAYWNEYSGASFSSLLNDSGVETGVAFSTSQNALGNTNGGTAIPDDPGSNRMLDGHFYVSPGETFGDITFVGLTYAKYDIYVYYNSMVIADNYQTFQIAQTGETKIGSELTPTVDTAFVESTGTNDANYVVFHDLTLSTVTLNAIAGSCYAYINGIQIVEVPEPATLCLLGLGSIGMIIKRKRG